MTNKPSRTGAAAIEFAFVFPIVFAIFFAFVEHGRYFMVMDVLQNAAREGARYAAVGSTDDAVTSDLVKDWVTKYLVGQELNLEPGFDIRVFMTDSTGTVPPESDGENTWKSLSYSNMVCVQITGTYKAILPLLTLMPATIDLDVRAVAFVEAN